ncbi:MAG: hypothetical protein DI598_12015, partial [Pseudopedobacter saltans]
MKTNWVKQQAALLLATVISSVLIGCTIAFFLWLLENATEYRNLHPYLLWLLPVGGLIIFFAYQKWGKVSSKGNNLVIEAVNQKNVD